MASNRSGNAAKAAAPVPVFAFQEPSISPPPESSILPPLKSSTPPPFIAEGPARLGPARRKHAIPWPPRNPDDDQGFAARRVMTQLDMLDGGFYECKTIQSDGKEVVELEWKRRSDEFTESAMHERVSHCGGLVGVRFSRSDCVGRGRHGSVYLGWGTITTGYDSHASGGSPKMTGIRAHVLAVKELNDNRHSIEKRIYELPLPPLESSNPLEFVCMLAMPPHPQICRLLDYTIVGEGTSASVLKLGFLEYLAGGSLKEYADRYIDAKAETLGFGGAADVTLTIVGHSVTIPARARGGGLPDVILRGILTQVLEALSFLQYQCLAHMDLAPENVVADRHGTWKLTDFGFVTPYNSNTAAAKEFSKLPPRLEYMDPDVMDLYEPENRALVNTSCALSYISSQADMFSLGVVLFWARTGVHPFPVYGIDTSDHVKASLYPRTQAWDAQDNFIRTIVRAYEQKLGVADFHPDWLCLVRDLLKIDSAQRPMAYSILSANEYVAPERDILLQAMIKPIEENESHSDSSAGAQKLGVSGAVIKQLKLTHTERTRLLQGVISEATAHTHRREDYEWPPVILDPPRFGVYIASHLMNLFPPTVYSLLESDDAVRLTVRDMPPEYEPEKRQAWLDERLRSRAGVMMVTFDPNQMLGAGGFGTVHLGAALLHSGPELPPDVISVVVKRLKRFYGDKRTVMVDLEENPDDWNDNVVVGRCREIYGTPFDFMVLTALRHPNIVRMHDFGVAHKQVAWFGIMEVLAGGSVNQFIERVRFARKQDVSDSAQPYSAGPGGTMGAQEPPAAEVWSYGALPQVMVRSVLVQLLQGLNFAHASGIAHHDLKPDNMMFTKHGDLKIVDYGLGTAFLHDLNENAPASADVADLKTVRVEWCGGTMRYLPPEAIALSVNSNDLLTMGLNIQKEAYRAWLADIYAVGMIAFELFTGQKPYHGAKRAPPYQHEIDRAATLAFKLIPHDKAWWFSKYVPYLASKGFIMPVQFLSLCADCMQPQWRNRTQSALKVLQDSAWLSPSADSLMAFDLRHGRIVPA